MILCVGENGEFSARKNNRFFKKSNKKLLTKKEKSYIIKIVLGDMAQLVERLVRNEEASGSNPLISTKAKNTPWGVFFALVR